MTSLHPIALAASLAMIAAPLPATVAEIPSSFSPPRPSAAFQTLALYPPVTANDGFRRKFHDGNHRHHCRQLRRRRRHTEIEEQTPHHWIRTSLRNAETDYGSIILKMPSKNEDVDVNVDDDTLLGSRKNNNCPCIIFPGGGLFFYWQAGVIAHLQREGYDLSSATLSGASAGALSATLAKTNVHPYDATELALKMSEEAGIWDRPAGLQGVWGGIIYDWLDQLLPEDAEKKVEDEELHILVTPVPSFGKTRISNFENRQDLIKANMASVHLPWFLDGNLTYNYRGKPHIDGSFLAQPSDYLPDKYSNNNKEQSNELILGFRRDPVMKDRASEFIKLVSKQTIWDIVEQGEKHARIMEGRGEFDLLK